MNNHWWSTREIEGRTMKPKGRFSVERSVITVPYCKDCDIMLEPSYDSDYYYHSRSECKHAGKKLSGLEMLQRMPA